MAIDNAGAVYIADQWNHRVQKWEPGATAGTTVAGGNGDGTAANQVSTPYFVAVDGRGSVFVSDGGSLTSPGEDPRLSVWPAGATAGTTLLSTNGPLTSTSAGAIYCYSPDGTIYKWTTA